MTNQRKDMDGAAPDRLAMNVFVDRNRLNQRSGAPVLGLNGALQIFRSYFTHRPNRITVIRA